MNVGNVKSWWGVVLVVGLASCEEHHPPSEGKPLFPPSITDNATTAASPEKQLSPTVPSKHQTSNFPPDKQKNLTGLLIANHYRQPARDAVFPQVASPVQLNQYLQSLDKYSRYLSPEENLFFQQRAQLKRTDIGINLLVHANEILAVPLQDSPATRAGLTHAHLLLAMNGRPVDFNDFSSYNFLTRLTTGDKVTLEVDDPATATARTYSITSAPYQRELATYDEYDELAVITVHEFQEKTTREIQEFLPLAMRKKALIIDLRYCPGGDLFATVDTLSLFLPPKKNVAYLRRQQEDNKPLALSTLSGQIFKNKPIYLLTSKYTASSAEVFIYAIQHHLKNSHLLGAATTGKCLALEKFELDDGSALQLSTHEILTPDRQPCNGLPIEPDIPVPNIEQLDIQEALQGLAQ